MSLLYDNLLRLTILKELDKKTSGLIEEKLHEYPFSVYELLTTLKIRRENYQGARLLMMERDEISSSTLNGDEYIYLKEKGLIVLYGRRYRELRKKNEANKIPAFVDVLTQRFSGL